MKEKLKSSLEIISVIILALFCLTESHAVKDSIYNAVMRCLETVIPSLYAMMILSRILTKSGLIGRISSYTGIFPPVFVFSVFAGYPVGTGILCSEYECGNISRRQAQVMSGICYGAGSAFINGCIAGRLYGKGSEGNIILISTVGADVILSLFMIPFLKGKYQKNDKIHISSNLLNESISESGRSMGIICLSVVFFSVISVFLQYTGIISLAGDMLSRITGRDKSICEGMIYTLMDITNAENLTKGDRTLLPFLSFVTAFGGVCVLFQIKAVTGERISLMLFIIMRIFAAVMSAVICRLIMPLMLKGETVYVSVNMSVHKAESPVPSVMLILMTFFIIGESNGLFNTNKKYSQNA
ncbi:MAG: hypothetical protein IJ666_02135 [Ruminococcus sp.]|nr:hypothetical protein [Ruminococcus sp.]